MLNQAPFDPGYHGDYGEQAERYFLVFHLEDGTTFKRAYWLNSGELWHGITLPQAFRVAVSQALNR